jgi:hypothetical protein
MEISCISCACSKCKHWKHCNDNAHEMDYWCFRCPEPELDFCHEPLGTCDSFIYDEALSHPVYCEATQKEAKEYYDRFDWKFLYRETYIS